MRLRVRLALFPIAVLLLPAGLLPQMPPGPARLVISSTPTGAVITINNRPMQQTTDATFNVSAPGTYQISVAGQAPFGGGKFQCPTKTVHVDPGQTVTLHCNSTNPGQW